MTCKLNEAVALNTEQTAELVRELNVVPLVADRTAHNPEADAWLERLGNKSHAIPYLAIFPAKDPHRPIVLDGPVTQGTVAEALRRAGASIVDGAERTAMR